MSSNTLATIGQISLKGKNLDAKEIPLADLKVRFFLINTAQETVTSLREVFCEDLDSFFDQPVSKTVMVALRGIDIEELDDELQGVVFNMRKEIHILLFDVTKVIEDPTKIQDIDLLAKWLASEMLSKVPALASSINLPDLTQQVKAFIAEGSFNDFLEVAGWVYLLKPNAIQQSIIAAFNQLLLPGSKPLAFDPSAAEVVGNRFHELFLHCDQESLDPEHPFNLAIDLVFFSKEQLAADPSYPLWMQALRGVYDPLQDSIPEDIPVSDDDDDDEDGETTRLFYFEKFLKLLKKLDPRVVALFTSATLNRPKYGKNFPTQEVKETFERILRETLRRNDDPFRNETDLLTIDEDLA